MKVRAVVIFRGRVQGVFFRAHCAGKAEKLGLDGFVRNRPDGSVEAVFEGERSTIEECIDWNKTSQPHAHVESVEVTWNDAEGGLAGFRVVH